MDDEVCLSLEEYHLYVRARDAAHAKLPRTTEKLCCYVCGYRYTSIVYLGYGLDEITCGACGSGGSVDYDDGDGPEMVIN